MISSRIFIYLIRSATDLGYTYATAAELPCVHLLKLAEHPDIAIGKFLILVQPAD
jgi:hypothetical protein